MIRAFGYFCLAVITGAIIASAGVLAWFIADRAMPVEVLESKVLTPTVRPGGKLIIRQKIAYLRDCRAHIDRVLFDEHTHREFLADVDYEHPPRGLGISVVTFETDVPDFFQPGEGQYRALPNYACNPLQRYYWPITRGETILRFRIE